MAEHMTLIDSHVENHICEQLLDTTAPEPGWHVLWTRSNFEKIVYEKLSAKGYEMFMPLISQWSRKEKGNGKRTSYVPMFKSYLFVHHAIDKYSYLDICKTDGLVSILGARWDKLAYVPKKEIEAIKLTVESDLPTMPYPYLKEGNKVRIIRGSLKNAEGIMVRSKPSNGLFVISVNLLRRSIAVEVDCSDIVPV